MIEIDIGTFKVNYDLAKGRKIRNLITYIYKKYGIIDNMITQVLKNGKETTETVIEETEIEESDKIAILWTQKSRHPLYLCAYGNNVKGIRFWVSQGVSPDIKDIYSGTPLIGACFFKSVDAIKELLHVGADTNLKDNNGKTALHHLLHANTWNEKTEEIIRLLMTNRINKDERDKYGKTARENLNDENKDRKSVV